MRLYLGIDGGGTKTSACVLDETGAKLSRGAGGPCNIISFPDETLRQSIEDASANAIRSAGLAGHTRFHAVCAGVAGYTSKSRRAEFQRILEETIPANAHRVEPDFTIAWWGATGGKPGVVCVAGTGAVAYGQNAAGESYRVDGRGFVLGRRALIVAMRELEAGEPAGPLTRAIQEYTGARDADDLVDWTNVGFDPAKISALAPVILAAASHAEDETALQLIRQAGARLRESVDLVFKQLSLPAETPVYPLGGLWQLGDTLVESFSQGTLSLRQPLHDSAYGAALLAMRLVQ